MFNKFFKNNKNCLFIFICIILFSTHVKSECAGLKLITVSDDIRDTSENAIKVFNISETVENSRAFSYDDFFNEAALGLIKQTNHLLDFLKYTFSTNEKNPIKVNYTVFNNNLTTNNNLNTHIVKNYTWENEKVLLNKYSSNITRINTTISNNDSYLNENVTKILGKDEIKTSTKDIYKEVGLDSDDENRDNEDNSKVDSIQLYNETTNDTIGQLTTEEVDVVIINPNLNNFTIHELIVPTITDNTGVNINLAQSTTEADIKSEIEPVIQNKTKINNESEYYINNFLNTKSENKLNDVLDDYIYLDMEEDTATDYPEMDYYVSYTKSTLGSSTTVTEKPMTSTTDHGFGILIPAYTSMRLCKDTKSISMSRLLGLRWDEENYWDGTFEPRRFGGLKKIDLVLALTVPVNITEVNNGIAEIINRSTFFIRGQSTSEPVKFKVKSLPGESFPFLKKVTLNGREICKEKVEWHPPVFGPQNLAVVSPLDSPHLKEHYNCGRSQIDFTPLVVKGLPTKEGDYPWHVALFSKNTVTKNWDYQCGGTILYRKTIITAAHCVTNNGTILRSEHLLVIVGKYGLYEVDRYQKAYKVKEIIVHENYTHEGRILENDLALLILEEHMEYGRYVQPICLWNKQQANKEIIYQEFGTVVGWGATENETLSETLLAAPMKVIPDTICLRSRPSFYRRYLNQNTFCAGNKNGTSACNGDSGGGLIFPITEDYDKTRWYLRGVVSAGVRRPGGLCDPNHFVVFADVAQYVDWIEEHQQL